MGTNSRVRRRRSKRGGSVAWSADDTTGPSVPARNRATGGGPNLRRRQASPTGGTHAGLDAGPLRSRSRTSSSGPSSSSPTRGRDGHGEWHRAHTYGDWAERTHRVGGVLDALGISADGRVATFAWNTARHLELYFAAPCTGRVLHTLNIRLFPDQLTYIANHAEDEVIFVDKSLTALLWPLLKTFDTVRHVVVMDDGKGDDPGGRRGRVRDPRLRDALGQCRRPVEFVVDGREPRGVDVLHERHDRQPEGRGVLAPVDVSAHDGRDDRRFARRRRVRRDPAGRADVPRQRVGARPRCGGVRRDARDAGSRPLGARRSPISSSTSASPSPRACRPSGWGCFPS